jgi:hypothetical protein
METETEKVIGLNQLPEIPAGAKWSYWKVERVAMPHPYCITPKHVAWASDRHAGLLSKEAVRDAEERGGATCDICRVRVRDGRQPHVLSIDEHENAMTVFLQVEQSYDLNAIDGLGPWLFEQKAEFEKLGIEGFAFATGRDIGRAQARR